MNLIEFTWLTSTRPVSNLKKESEIGDSGKEVIEVMVPFITFTTPPSLNLVAFTILSCMLPQEKKK
jgi:hypothetical protein